MKTFEEITMFFSDEKLKDELKKKRNKKYKI